MPLLGFWAVLTIDRSLGAGEGRYQRLQKRGLNPNLSENV